MSEQEALIYQAQHSNLVVVYVAEWFGNRPDLLLLAIHR